MSEQDIREAVEQVLGETILWNWRYYGLLAAVSLLATAIGNWVGSYAKKRGEALATKSDFQEVLRQLRFSTKTTEEIKSAVQHSDWANREWKIVRRNKLEELLDNAYAAEHWLEACRDRWMFQATADPGPDPTDKVKRLSALYFPELREQTLNLVAAQRAAISWSVSAGQKILAAGSDHAAREQVLDSILPAWSSKYAEVLRRLAEIESKATELMTSFRGF